MSNPFSYEGKRVVVTGAATGVGAALLDLLAELGAPEVTVIDIKEPSGPHARFVEANLSDQTAVEAAAAQIDGRIDVLFNNAGVAATQAPRVVLAVNYLALRRLSERLLDQIPAGGAIVNTASIAGGRWSEHLAEINALLDIGDWDASLDWVDANLEAVGGDSYGFSKEVVRVWGMRSSRATGERGVRTNSVCPAPIDTPLLEDFKATIGEKLIEWTVEGGHRRADDAARGGDAARVPRQPGRRVRQRPRPGRRRRVQRGDDDRPGGLLRDHGLSRSHRGGSAMRAVRSAPPGVTVVDVDEPSGPGEVITIKSAGICASDFLYISYGFTMLLGHELAGVTEDGTPVAIEAHLRLRGLRAVRPGSREPLRPRAHRARGHQRRRDERVLRRAGVGPGAAARRARRRPTPASWSRPRWRGTRAASRGWDPTCGSR